MFINLCQTFDVAGVLFLMHKFDSGSGWWLEAAHTTMRVSNGAMWLHPAVRPWWCRGSPRHATTQVCCTGRVVATTWLHYRKGCGEIQFWRHLNQYSGWSAMHLQGFISAPRHQKTVTHISMGRSRFHRQGRATTFATCIRM